MTAQVVVDGEHHTVTGEGSGPISAFVRGLRASFGVELDVVDYAEHAIGRGAEATAAAYVESIAGTADDGGSSETRWGIGIDPDITTAGLKAVLGALERQQRSSGQAHCVHDSALTYHRRPWRDGLAGSSDCVYLGAIAGGGYAIWRATSQGGATPHVGPPATWPPLEVGEPPVAALGDLVTARAGTGADVGRRPVDGACPAGPSGEGRQLGDLPRAGRPVLRADTAGALLRRRRRGRGRRLPCRQGLVIEEERP